MKKRLFLGILPALLTLSACSGGAAQPKEEKNLFLEDTLAHDEIFGGAELEERALAPKRLLAQDFTRKLDDPDPVTHPDADDFSIGVQSLSESTGYISFRFVAAVHFEDSQVGPTQAVWTRTVSYTTGAVKKAEGTFSSQKAYQKLSTSSGAYSISDYNTAHGTNYTRFVVYTLRNVPVDENDYYVSAYLTLSTKEGQSGGKDLTSRAVAVNASETAKFAYDLGNSGGAFFIEGTINSLHTIIPASRVRENGNKADFEDINLNVGDKFEIKEFYNLELEVHGPTAFRGDVSAFDLKSDGGKIGVNYKGQYSFYLKYEDDQNKLYTKARYLKRHYFVDITNCDWFTGPELYVFGEGVDAKYISLSQIGTSKFYETDEDLDPTIYTGAIVMRRESSSAENWWNQTVNIPLNQYDDGIVKNCIQFTGDGGDKTKTVVWTSKLS